jgi:site-specific recombinase XerC
MWRHLKAALDACSHPAVTWYEATKHTFASHYLMNGGRIERLATILGHTDTEVTRRYAHLAPDKFTAKDFAAMSVQNSYRTATEQLQIVLLVMVRKQELSRYNNSLRP